MQRRVIRGRVTPAGAPARKYDSRVLMPAAGGGQAANAETKRRSTWSRRGGRAVASAAGGWARTVRARAGDRVNVDGRPGQSGNMFRLPGGGT